MTERSDGGIPHSVLDTRGLPRQQAFSLWQEHISRYYDLRAQREFGQDFDVRADFWHLGNVLFADFRVPPQDWSRSRACIGRVDMDLFMVQILTKGWNGPRDSGVTARAGDIMVFDMSQPTDRRGGDNRALTLFLPRNLLGPHLKASDESPLRVLPAHDPLAALLRDHLLGFHARLSEMSPDQAQAVMPATVQLTAAALNGTIRQEQAGAIRVAVVERICSYINAHLLDPSLTPQGIADRFGMTRRNLGYLFESHGGVAAYIRRKRLSSIRAALIQPAHKRGSIEAIAEAHGFNHYRSFALAFQKQFGLTPREVRARGLEGAALSSSMPYDKLAQWTHWLEFMK
ncbi:helix-turn-helix domain-containing protein [Bradyrhizobium sp. 18BD]